MNTTKKAEDTNPEPASIDRDNRRLAELYPKPKTYDELQADQARIELLRESRLPKHIVVRTIVRFYALILLLLVIAVIVPGIVYWNTFSGVFLSFFIGLVWLMITYFQIGKAANELHLINIGSEIFFAAYGTNIVLLAAVSYKISHIITPTAMMVGLPLLLLVVHSFTVWLLATIIRANTVSSVKKALGILAFTTVSMTAAVVSVV